METIKQGTYCTYMSLWLHLNGKIFNGDAKNVSLYMYPIIVKSLSLCLGIKRKNVICKSFAISLCYSHPLIFSIKLDRKL